MFYDATIGRVVDAILIAWDGRRIAVLGARGAGKTHFVRFLASEPSPQDHKQTLAPDKLGNQRLALSDLDVRLKSLLDLSGAEEARGHWKRQVDKADFVFYLVRADKVLSDDANTMGRIASDGRHISDWLNSRDKRPKVCIVGTHCDLDPSFIGQTHNLHGDYTTRFRARPVIKSLIRSCGGAAEVELVVGSMMTPQSTRELVTDAFRHVMAEV